MFNQLDLSDFIQVCSDPIQIIWERSERLRKAREAMRRFYLGPSLFARLRSTTAIERFV